MSEREQIGGNTPNTLNWNTDVSQMPATGNFLVWLSEPRLGSSIWPIRKTKGASSSVIITLGERFSWDCEEQVLAWAEMPDGPML